MSGSLPGYSLTSRLVAVYSRRRDGSLTAASASDDSSASERNPAEKVTQATVGSALCHGHEKTQNCPLSRGSTKLPEVTKLPPCACYTSPLLSWGNCGCHMIRCPSPPWGRAARRDRGGAARAWRCARTRVSISGNAHI